MDRFTNGCRGLFLRSHPKDQWHSHVTRLAIDQSHCLRLRFNATIVREGIKRGYPCHEANASFNHRETNKLKIENKRKNRCTSLIVWNSRIRNKLWSKSCQLWLSIMFKDGGFSQLAMWHDRQSAITRLQRRQLDIGETELMAISKTRKREWCITEYTYTE